MFKSFLIPVAEAALVYAVASLVPVSAGWFGVGDGRLAHILACAVKSLLWLVPYAVLLQCTKTVDFLQLIKETKR